MPRARRTLPALALALLALVALPRTAGAVTANDPFLVAGDQWALTGAVSSIDAPDAWCRTTGAGVVVADVDTGATFGHEDLVGKLVAGAAFLGGSGAQTGAGAGSVTDGFGHGTMTTGIMVARTGNARGVAAVAPDARALVVKVLDDRGSGYDSDVAAGIRYAADQGASAINVSIGPDVGVSVPVGSAIPAAVDYASQRGSLVVLAAGNSGNPIGSYPTVTSEALIVGALGADGTVASYSNNAVGVNIYAPGGDGSDIHHLVVAPTSGGTGAYAVGAGTSFAAPHVTGVAALLAAQGLTPAAARSRILATAIARNGAPELDAAAAVGATRGCAPPVTAGAASAPPAAGTPATAHPQPASAPPPTSAPVPSAPASTPAGPTMAAAASSTTGSATAVGTASPTATAAAAPAPPPLTSPAPGGGVPLGVRVLAGAGGVTLSVAGTAAAALVARRRPRL